MSPAGTLTVERRGHLLLMGLNRPDKLNAFNVEMILELARAYEELETDPELRCGVLHAHGADFTSGLDMADVVPALMSGELGMEGEGMRHPWRIDGKRWTKPVIAAAEGRVFTLGIELLLAADISVASREATFSQIEINRGIYPFGGATVRLPAATGWGNAMRWLLTGETYDAVEAHRIGVIQELTDPGRALERAIEIADRIATRSAPLGVKTTLLSAQRGLTDRPGAFASLQEEMIELSKTDDAREGLLAFLERRDANFGGR